MTTPTTEPADEPPAVEGSALPDAVPVADDLEWQPMGIPDESQ